MLSSLAHFVHLKYQSSIYVNDVHLVHQSPSLILLSSFHFDFFSLTNFQVCFCCSYFASLTYHILYFTLCPFAPFVREDFFLVCKHSWYIVYLVILFLPCYIIVHFPSWDVFIIQLFHTTHTLTANYLSVFFSLTSKLFFALERVGNAFCKIFLSS